MFGELYKYHVQVYEGSQVARGGSQWHQIQKAEDADQVTKPEMCQLGEGGT